MIGTYLNYHDYIQKSWQHVSAAALGILWGMVFEQRLKAQRMRAQGDASRWTGGRPVPKDMLTATTGEVYEIIYNFS